MAGNVRLKHIVMSEGEKMVYFYEGELKAKDGVISIPANRPEWIRRSWILGFRLDPETGEQKRIEELIEV